MPSAPRDHRIGRGDALREILELSEKMLEAAQSKDWNFVTIKEPERHRMVWDFFARPLSRQEIDLYSGPLKRILEVSRELTSLSQEHRTQVGGELGRLRQGKRVYLAYKRHAGA